MLNLYYNKYVIKENNYEIRNLGHFKLLQQQV